MKDRGYRSELSALQVATQFAARDESAGTPVKTVTVTDPGDNVITHRYDALLGRKVAEIDALGNETQFGYDVGGFLRTVTDPNGNAVISDHDVRGNTVSQTTCQNHAENRCSTVYYSYFPDATTSQLPPDPRNDRLLTVRDGRSSSAADDRYLTSYDYATVNGQLRVTITDPLDRQTITLHTHAGTVAVDGGAPPPGLPERLTLPGGGTQTVEYYRSGDVARVTDPAGMVTDLTYDALGRLLSKTVRTDRYPDGLTTSFTYDKLNRLATQTDPPVTNRVSGAVHTAVTTAVYDEDGLLTSETVSDATGGDAPRTSNWDYNDLGQPITISDPDERETRLGYNPFGMVVSERDADDGEIRTNFDALGRMLSTTLVNYTGDPNDPVAPQDLVLESRTYDPAGRLAEVTDAMGWVTAYTYTDNGLAATISRRDPATGATHVTEANRYDAAGNLIEATSNNGTTTETYAVDAAGRTTSSTVDPGGLNRVTTYTYSPEDYLLSTRATDGAGVTLGYEESSYDPLGRVTSSSYADDAAELATLPPDQRPSSLITTSWALDTAGLPFSMTDPAGTTTEYQYDEAGRLAVTTGPETTAWIEAAQDFLPTRSIATVGYDTFGAAVETRDPNGNVTVAEYDAAGRVTRTMLPSYTPPGSATPIQPQIVRDYDELGQLTSVIDPVGNETSYRYDQLGRVATVTAPNTGKTTYRYDPLGDVLAVTDATGATETATYDYLGRRLTSTQVVRQNSTNYTTTYAYDAAGWLESVRTPAGVTTSQTYNAVGQVATATDPANGVTRFDYDALGRPIRETAPDGTYATVDYDGAGRPVRQRDFDAADVELTRTTTSYDNRGQVTETISPNGGWTRFGYDASGQLEWLDEQIDAQESIRTRYGYDPAGNRTHFWNGRDHLFRTTYNSWNLPEAQIEPVTTAHPELASRTFTTAYDAAGRPVSTSLPGNVSITSTFDKLGNVTGQVGTGAEAATVDREFGYDLAGRLTSASAPGGTNAFSYDDRGLLLSADGPSGTSSFSYDGDGRMATRTDATGTTSYGYDSAGRLARVTNPGTGVDMSVTYNPMSQVQQIVYGDTGNRRLFGYDALHRTVSDELRKPDGTVIAAIAYGFDANGNEISKTTTGFTGSASNTYTYDLADRLTSWDNGVATTTYTYDKAGNRTGVGTRTFAYDQRNRVTGDSAGASYQYTARGTLAAKSDSGGTVTTASDAFGQVISQESAPGEAQTYAYDAFGRLHRPGFAYTGLGNTLAADGDATYTRDIADVLVGVAEAGEHRHAWLDLHSDVVGQFTATGTSLAASTTYDPLGTALATTGGLGNLGYQSEWTDSSTGRVNMWARWYNTDTGQFDSRDSLSLSPVPDSIEANRYAYASVNPMTVTDPTGHFSFRSLGRSVSNAWNATVNRASSAWSATTRVVSKAWQATTRVVSNAWRMTKNAVSNAISTTKRVVNNYREKAQRFVAERVDRAAEQARKMQAELERRAAIAKKKFEAGRRAVARQANRVVENVKETIADARQAGSQLKAAAVRVGQHAFVSVKDAAAATEKWVKEHKELLTEIGAIGLGVVAGLACAAATAGTAAVACMVGAAALINLAKEAAQGDVNSWSDGASSLGVGALHGLAGGVGGVVGGKVAALVAGKVGGLAASLGGRAFGGAVDGAGADVIGQVATTGRVDLRGVAMSAVTGAAFGARAGGGAPRPAAGGGGVDTRAPGRLDRGVGDCTSARRHSFDPDTRVVMGDGSSRRIAEIKIGDEVQATDPGTGESAARTVTVLHRNQDKDLAVVSVRSEDGRTSVLKTTWHHPFWDASGQKWTDARELEPGTRLHSRDGGTVTVVAVAAWLGDKTMYDLTVEDIHTYYVLAGETPVLVHNTNGCWPGLDDLSASAARPAKGGLTHAGREYQKHMGRGELPKVPGKQLDTAGQDYLDDILTTPGTQRVPINGGGFKGGYYYIRPDGAGAAFDSNGVFQYFGKF